MTPRLKRSLILLLLGLTVVLSLYLSCKVQQHLDTQPERDNHLPDAFMTTVTAKRMNKLGQLESVLVTPRLTHYPKDDVSIILTPQLTVYHAPNQPWLIKAKQATSHNGIDLMILQDHVNIHQSAGNNNYETTLLTSELTLYPKRNFAETNKLVTLLQPGSQVQAVGMQISLTQGWVKLLSQARGFYDPSAYNKKPA